MKSLTALLALMVIGIALPVFAAQSKNASAPAVQKRPGPQLDMSAAFPPKMQAFPLYGEGPIPNSKPGPDEESGADRGFLKNVSRPEIQVYLPAKMRATGAGIVVIPGGGYAGLTFDHEGTEQAQFFVDHDFVHSSTLATA